MVVYHAAIASKTRFACVTPSKMRLVPCDSSKTRFAVCDSQENDENENRTVGLQHLRPNVTYRIPSISSAQTLRDPRSSPGHPGRSDRH